MLKTLIKLNQNKNIIKLRPFSEKFRIQFGINIREKTLFFKRSFRCRFLKQKKSPLAHFNPKNREKFRYWFRRILPSLKAFYTYNKYAFKLIIRFPKKRNLFKLLLKYNFNIKKFTILKNNHDLKRKTYCKKLDSYLVCLLRYFRRCKQILKFSLKKKFSKKGKRKNRFNNRNVNRFTKNNTNSTKNNKGKRRFPGKKIFYPKDFFSSKKKSQEDMLWLENYLNSKKTEKNPVEASFDNKNHFDDFYVIKNNRQDLFNKTYKFFFRGRKKNLRLKLRGKNFFFHSLVAKFHKTKLNKLTLIKALKKKKNLKKFFNAWKRSQKQNIYSIYSLYSFYALKIVFSKRRRHALIIKKDTKLLVSISYKNLVTFIYILFFLKKQFKIILARLLVLKKKVLVKKNLQLPNILKNNKLLTKQNLLQVKYKILQHELTALIPENLQEKKKNPKLAFIKYVKKQKHILFKQNMFETKVFKYKKPKYIYNINTYLDRLFYTLYRKRLKKVLRRKKLAKIRRSIKIIDLESINKSSLALKIFLKEKFKTVWKGPFLFKKKRLMRIDNNTFFKLKQNLLLKLDIQLGKPTMGIILKNKTEKMFLREREIIYNLFKPLKIFLINSKTYNYTIFGKHLLVQQNQLLKRIQFNLIKKNIKKNKFYLMSNSTEGASFLFFNRDNVTTEEQKYWLFRKSKIFLTPGLFEKQILKLKSFLFTRSLDRCAHRDSFLYKYNKAKLNKKLNSKTKFSFDKLNKNYIKLKKRYKILMLKYKLNKLLGIEKLRKKNLKNKKDFIQFKWNKNTNIFNNNLTLCLLSKLKHSNKNISILYRNNILNNVNRLEDTGYIYTLLKKKPTILGLVNNNFFIFNLLKIKRMFSKDTRLKTKNYIKFFHSWLFLKKKFNKRVFSKLFKRCNTWLFFLNYTLNYYLFSKLFFIFINTFFFILLNKFNKIRNTLKLTRFELCYDFIKFRSNERYFLGIRPHTFITTFNRRTRRGFKLKKFYLIYAVYLINLF